MAYMLLILEDGGQRSARSAEVAKERYEQMMVFRHSLEARGLYLASDALGSDARGVRVSRHNGKQRITDGPFTEAREMVGGYFLLDCATRDEAVALASECPACDWATVEVRDVAPCHVDHAPASDAAFAKAS